MKPDDLKELLQVTTKKVAKAILCEVEMNSVCSLRDDGYKEYTISELALNEISDKYISLEVDDD